MPKSYLGRSSMMCVVALLSVTACGSPDGEKHSAVTDPETSGDGAKGGSGSEASGGKSSNGGSDASGANAASGGASGGATNGGSSANPSAGGSGGRNANAGGRNASTGGNVSTGGANAASGGANAASGGSNTAQGGTSSGTGGSVSASGGATSNGPKQWGGVTFPWQVFDGSVPDVAPAASPGVTYYCNPSAGDDSFDGTSFTFVSGKKGPKKTLTAALDISALKAGDTILLGGGIYRERPNFNGVAGKAGAPITIGSYGHGTGAPIFDGGLKPSTWTRVGTSRVWQTSTATLTKLTSTRPVLGVYVHQGDVEAALKEVIHGQVTKYGSEPLPPNETQANIAANSNKWYFDAAGKVLYADFGGTLGDGDPNSADISIIYNSSGNREPLFVFSGNTGYLRFVGLTLRAGSWHGVYSEVSNLSFEHCDVKFNGGGGFLFDASSNDLSLTGNSVTFSRVWMNVLENWPRFNNGNTGGGWPSALGFYSQSNARAEGNVVYANGGEGIDFFGTTSSGSTDHVSVNNVVRHNVVYDNFSVNLYLDNTQGALIEQNFVFNHPRDPNQTFENLYTTSAGYNTDFGKRTSPIHLSLGDEPGSANDGEAHSKNITVINNIFAGGKFGFVDYDDGTEGVYHGLKQTLIANNTWVLDSQALPGQAAYGWRHLNQNDNPDQSQDGVFQNNLIVSASADDHFIETGMPNAGPGINCDYNAYSGPGRFLSVSTAQAFAAWKSAHPSWDQHSINVDVALLGATAFRAPVTQTSVYDWKQASLASGSAAIAKGADLSARFSGDFTGATRAAGAFDIGAVTTR